MSACVELGFYLFIFMWVVSRGIRVIGVVAGREIAYPLSLASPFDASFL